MADYKLQIRPPRLAVSSAMEAWREAGESLSELLAFAGVDACATVQTALTVLWAVSSAMEAWREGGESPSELSAFVPLCGAPPNLVTRLWSTRRRREQVRTEARTHL